MQMHELLLELVEKAKTNKKALRSLKHTAILCQQYQLAANLRDIERELFPETDEIKDAKTLADKRNLVLRMVDIKTDDRTAWLLFEAIKLHSKMKGKFSMNDAVKLMEKATEIFQEDE